MRIYLETSAINRLVKDPDYRKLADNIRATLNMDTYISVFTVLELAAIKEREERNKYLVAAREITSKRPPIAAPGELLKRSFKALQFNQNEIDIFISDDEGIGDILCAPHNVRKEVYTQLEGKKRHEEQWYQQMHESGRCEMQKLLNTLPQNEVDSLCLRPSRLIKHFMSQPGFIDGDQPRFFINDFVRSMAKQGYDILISKPGAAEVIRKSEYWRYFLASMAYGIFTRAIQKNNFGKKKNLGSIDIQQALYLAACDVFVSDDNDKEQLKLMRWLVPFGHIKKRIWNFEQFKSMITEKRGECTWRPKL